ncbi:MAG: hypothetical protein FWC50_08465 [Planctomycetaceae bacterium]|nr:hypothetical protein [Planctomycetaceae bacterium]
MNLFNAAGVERILDSLFEKYSVSDKAIQAATQQLMSAKNYRAAANLLYAAIRNHQSQPWMYGALPLILEADKAPAKEQERALLSSAPFMLSPDERFALGGSLERIGADRRALQIYREVCKMMPNMAQPYRNAIRLAESLEDENALKEITLDIAAQTWNGDLIHEIWQRGSNIANGLLAKMRAENRNAEADAYEKALREAMQSDCVVSYEYVGDAEVAISVKEPANTICWFGNPRTLSGGILGKNRGGSDQKNAQKTGSYTCPVAFSGNYEILIERIWGNVTANKVKVTVSTHYGTDHTRKEESFVTLDDHGMALVRFELQNGRRTQSLSETELAAAINDAVQVRRASDLAKNLAGQSGHVMQNTENTLAKNGASSSETGQQSSVGQPERIIVPSGSSLPTGSSSGQSGRFVRVSPAANFQSVKKVTTFNTTTGATSDTTYCP